MRSLIVLSLLGLIGFSFKHMTIQITPSMNHTLYVFSSALPQKGDRVNFWFQHPLVLDNKRVKFVKKIRCVAGDNLVFGNDMFFCNGDLIGMASPIKLAGKTIPVFEFNGVIPDGMAFVLGESPNSFDSRYWGFISMSKMTRLIPII